MNDYYCVDEASDREDDDSSSDDEDFRRLTDLIDLDGNDFDTEMQRESENHKNGVHCSERAVMRHQSRDQSRDQNGHLKLTDESVSDQINDDLLYDPQADDCDQKWVNEQRMAVECESGSGMRSNSSDATLNCPSCMCLLCMDCQRHEVYKTQYRAMFVFNCNIDFSKRLLYKNKKCKRRANNCNDNMSEDLYYSVKCAVCNTEVAVYDNHEVYHFFSVLASYG